MIFKSSVNYQQWKNMPITKSCGRKSWGQPRIPNSVELENRNECTINENTNIHYKNTTCFFHYENTS